MNYYLTGIEGMPKLIDSIGDPLKNFKRNLYPAAFQEFYQQNFETLDAIEKGYNSVIDQEQFITNMAEALVEHVVETVNSCSKKSAREHTMMNMNMAMVVFVFPIILRYQGNSSRPLADKLELAWKREFPKTNIQAADYDYIEQGFHKKFCYITTAVCESFGKPDDCYELTLLRNYRDTYLASLPDGEELIREYYDVAPAIVKHIGQRSDAHEIYRSIYDSYLSPCIDLIEGNRLEECRERYEDMVHTLRDQYFYH